MRKNSLLRWMFPVLISVVLLGFSACDEEELPQDPTPTDQVSVDDTTPEEPDDEVHVHAWSEWYESGNPTCAREGEKTRECSCGERQTESIPTLQHTVVYSQATAPTCTEAGSTDGSYCSACGVIIAPQEAIAPLGHTPVQLEAVAPTCMSTGSTAGTICSVCSTVLVKSETIAPLEHTKTSRVIAPTCVLAGYTETECAICHVTETSDYTDPLGHTESIISGKQPTCTQSGVTDGKSCTVCHAVYVEQTVIPALGHKETVVAGYDATCTQAGLTDGVNCLVCEAVVTPQTVIPQKQHSYREVKVAPTCLEKGYTEKTCLGCADSFREQFVTATGHTVVDVPAVGATCFTSGMTGSAYCSGCGETLLSGEIIPPLDHTPVSVPAVEPTCQATGWTEGVACAACDTVLSDRKIVQKTEHVYGTAVVAPTCLEGGYTLFTCSGCQDTYRDRFRDATGHSYGDWYLEETSGRTVSTCEGCGDARHAVKLEAVYTGGSLFVGDRVYMDDLSVTVTLSDNSTFRTSSYELENDRIAETGTNLVTTCLGGLRSSVSIYAIYPNLDATTPIDEFTYKLSGNTITITAYNGTATKIVIPAHVDGVPVTALGAGVFKNQTTITSVTIPGSVITVGKELCYGCSALDTVILHDGIGTIGAKAFYGCPITEVNIPDSVTAIGQGSTDGAFEGCQKLERVVIGDGLVSIAGETFRDCVSLTGVVIGDSVTSIGSSAFSGCTGLLSVTMGEAVQTIGNSAFYGCTALADVTFGASVRTINSGAFRNCMSIQSIDIPSNVQTIGTSAFEGCTGLTTLTLNEGLQTIEGCAFYGCPITEVIIPDSVAEINVYSGIGAFEGCGKLERVVIGDGLVTIVNDTFRNCVSLTSVVFGDSVTSIGSSAFEGCTALPSVTIGEAVQTIGSGAFYGCTALADVTFGASVRTINRDAFKNCTSIQSIDIPSNVQTIGTSAFEGCTGLTTLTLNEGLQTIEGCAFYGCPITEVIIPDSVAEINVYSGIGAFEGCGKLERVVIGDGLVSIASETFRNCVSLTSVVFGDSVKTIGNSAFRGCSSLTDIDFGRSVQTISGYAFADCTALETVTIPATVQTIDNNAFSGCLILEIIRMENGVQTIGASAFANCPALESVTIPASVCSIGNSTFQGCTELSDVTLQKGRLKTVGNNVFKNCSSIKRIYYGGTASDWEQISVSETNQYPLTVTPYYYSKSEPAEEGNYWFFSRGGEETVWNVTENAYRSDIYTDEFVGPYTSGASYAGQCIADLSSDLAFVASFTAWETLHIVTTPSYAFESGAISRKDLYKLAIFDVLGVQEMGVPLIFEACDTETFSYLVEISKEAFDGTYHVDVLKQLDADQFKSTILASDTLENIGIGLEIFSLLIDKAENAYDAILLCARYIAITNLGDNFEVILTDIANDTSNASDMRAAARECVEVMRAGCSAYLLEMVKKEFIVDEIQTIAGFIIDTAWGKLIEFIPGAGTVMLIGKGLRILGNELFNMDGKIQAYYQLDAAVRLEKAIKRMVLNGEPDYLRCDKTEEAGVYVNVLQMYKKVILKGYDYSIDFYSEDGAGQGKLAAVEAERDALDAEFVSFEQGIDERYDAYLLSEPVIA